MENLALLLDVGDPMERKVREKATRSWGYKCWARERKKERNKDILTSSKAKIGP